MPTIQVTNAIFTGTITYDEPAQPPDGGDGIDPTAGLITNFSSAARRQKRSRPSTWGWW